MRTRCKFKVVGVEDTEGHIFRKVYEEDFEDAEAFEHVNGVVYTDNYTSDEKRKGKKYKSIATGKYIQNIRLAAQYDSRKQEDLSFADATPSGELKILVSNPVVVGTFKPGDCYYLDLIPCE